MSEENETYPEPKHPGCRRYLPEVIGGAYCPHCERLDVIGDYRAAVEEWGNTEAGSRDEAKVMGEIIKLGEQLVGELETLTLEEAERDA